MAEAMQAMNDPAVMAEAMKMMKDPQFVQQLQAMQNDPAMRRYMAAVSVIHDIQDTTMSHNIYISHFFIFPCFLFLLIFHHERCKK